ncbi:MAG: WecB/TagA/CpsF family glycosyltransferase [Sedimentisphaerales bacterium]|nr:WecB/TagA/CpsF family glycosyltransferase [Sedimentisphaerales bacterium]
MINTNQKQSILQVRFDLIAYHAVMETIERWRQNCEQHYVTITNPHSVMMCIRDSEMRKATEMATMTLPDGIGIIIAAFLLGYQHSGRATGPMLMLKLCDWGRQKGYRHFFYGGAEGVVEKLSDRLLNIYPGLKVAGTYCPPFGHISREENEEIIYKINSAKPDIVWIGLGAPKQEKWMAEHLGHVKAAAMIGVGAAFDFHSGNVKWAPEWIRKYGLEWAYRFIKEPKRMFKRNLDSPIFLVKVIQQFISENLHSRDSTISPQT